MVVFLCFYFASEFNLKRQNISVNLFSDWFIGPFVIDFRLQSATTTNGPEEQSATSCSICCLVAFSWLVSLMCQSGRERKLSVLILVLLVSGHNVLLGDGWTYYGPQFLLLDGTKVRHVIGWFVSWLFSHDDMEHYIKIRQYNDLYPEDAGETILTNRMNPRKKVVKFSFTPGNPTETYSLVLG